MELREFPIFRDSEMSGGFVIERNRILLFTGAYKAARFRVDVLTHHSKNLRYLVWVGDTRRLFTLFCFPFALQPTEHFRGKQHSKDIRLRAYGVVVGDAISNAMPGFLTREFHTALRRTVRNCSR